MGKCGTHSSGVWLRASGQSRAAALVCLLASSRHQPNAAAVPHALTTRSSRASSSPPHQSSAQQRLSYRERRSPTIGHPGETREVSAGTGWERSVVSFSEPTRGHSQQKGRHHNLALRYHLWAKKWSGESRLPAPSCGLASSGSH